MPHTHTVMRRGATGLLVAACAAALLLAGCGKPGGKGGASQVLAKVNGDEISVHQLNHLLSSQPGLAQAADDARRRMLERLVDRQLVYREAVKEELDRSPEVMLAIEEAKREIIASAYAKKIASGLPAPTEQEVAAYYTGHPGLFGQRRIYQLRELTLPLSAPQAAEVKAAAAKGETLDAIAARLKGQGVSFGFNAGVRAAEQLPIDALDRLAAAGAGQQVVFEGAGSLILYQVLQSQPRPVDQATAAPRIREFLANRAAGKAVEAEVKRLREAATIEYVGDPAQAGPAAVAAPEAAALSGEEAAKGVAGLK